MTFFKAICWYCWQPYYAETYEERCCQKCNKEGGGYMADDEVKEETERSEEETSNEEETPEEEKSEE